MSSAITTPVQGAAPLVSAQRTWLRPKYLLFAFIGLMYAYVLWHNERFLISHADPEWSHIAPFKWWLLPHGLASAFALFLGPFQFSERLRKRFTRAHRVMGRFYVLGTIIGAPLGFYIQFYQHQHKVGPLSLNFAAGSQAIVWIFTTIVAMAFIFRGQVQQHRQWMTRSFACALIFLEARVITGTFNLDLDKFTDIVVWGCVAAAVPLADFVLYAQELFRKRATPAKKTQRATLAT